MHPLCYIDWIYNTKTHTRKLHILTAQILKVLCNSNHWPKTILIQYRVSRDLYHPIWNPFTHPHAALLSPQAMPCQKMMKFCGRNTGWPLYQSCFQPSLSDGLELEDQSSVQLLANSSSASTICGIHSVDTLSMLQTWPWPWFLMNIS